MSQTLASDFKEQLESGARNALLHSHLDVVVAPFSRLLLKLIYVSDLVRWRRRRARAEFNHGHRPSIDFANKEQLYAFLLTTRNLDEPIDYWEFGVYRGYTLRWWAEHNPHADSRFVGFDTFSGLPEDWEHVKKGTFSTGGRLPDISDGRVSFEVGLFQDTLGTFLAAAASERRRVIHLDADLYSATLFVLTTLAPRLRRGDILIFDELATSDGFTHEFRALCDFAAAYRVEYQLLGAARCFSHVAVELV